MFKTTPRLFSGHLFQRCGGFFSYRKVNRLWKKRHSFIIMINATAVVYIYLQSENKLFLFPRSGGQNAALISATQRFLPSTSPAILKKTWRFFLLKFNGNKHTFLPAALHYIPTLLYRTKRTRRWRKRPWSTTVVLYSQGTAAHSPSTVERIVCASVMDRKYNDYNLCLRVGLHGKYNSFIHDTIKKILNDIR